MHIADILARVGVDGGVSAEIEQVEPLGPVLRVDASDTAAALAALKDSDLAYVMLVDLFGIDIGEAVDIVYHVRSLSSTGDAYLKARYEYGSALTSVWKVHPAALLPERECAEMFGLSLEGHPNPKRLLTVEGAMLPPLLKSTEIRTAEEVRSR